MERIGRYSKCKLHALELYEDLKARKKITSFKEFKLFYSNAQKVLTRLLGKSFELDEAKFETPDPDEKYKDLEDEIFKFEWKSANRSKHIAGLITYLSGLRGSNNINLYDIHHWLLTTDQTTLKIDLDLCFAHGFKSKPVCILPTELLTALSGHKDLEGEYVEVFKKFMLYSNVFEKEYSDDDLLIINGVIDLVEEYEDTDYDPDVMIDALIEEDFLSEVKNRFSKAKNQAQKKKEVADFFVEHYNRTYKGKFNKVVTQRFSISYRNIKFLFRLPAILLTIWFIYLLFNWSGLVLNDPKTWAKTEDWGPLEVVFAVVVPGLWLITRIVFKYGIPFKTTVNYMISKYDLNKSEAEKFAAENLNKPKS